MAKSAQWPWSTPRIGQAFPTTPSKKSPLNKSINFALVAVASCDNPQPPAEKAPPPQAQIEAADTVYVGGEMIMAYGYDDTAMPDGRRLNRDDLDKAFPDNPVRVDHVSMHGAVLDGLALKHYGIDANTETPAGGIIVRKPGTRHHDRQGGRYSPGLVADDQARCERRSQ